MVDTIENFLFLHCQNRTRVDMTLLQNPKIKIRHCAGFHMKQKKLLLQKFVTMKKLEKSEILISKQFCLFNPNSAGLLNIAWLREGTVKNQKKF